MIDQHRLPIHGSMVQIQFTNGKTKTVVFFGDSGAGKSESIEALQEIAGNQIIHMETIFDDMGSFTLDSVNPHELYAQGTEIGAFVRLDDLSSAVAFNNMDRGVYLNPEQKNAAKQTFIAGKRFALGTTDEVGMSTTFFANPFGPVQEPEQTRPIIDQVFNLLFDQNIYVGELYTHLGNDKSKESLHQSVQELLNVLMTM